MRKLLLASICSAVSLLAGTSVPAQTDTTAICPCGGNGVVCYAVQCDSLSMDPWKFAVGGAPPSALLSDSDTYRTLIFTPEDKTVPILSVGKQHSKDVITLYDQTNDKTLAVVIDGHLFIAAGESPEHVLQVVLQTIGVVSGKISVNP